MKRQTDRHVNMQMNRETDGKINKRNDQPTDKHRQRDASANKQTDRAYANIRKEDIQADRQGGEKRGTNMLISVMSLLYTKIISRSPWAACLLEMKLLGV